MKTILCYGDSNTWGHRAPAGDRFDENTRWGSRLRTLLGDDYRVIEEGQRGRTTVWDDPVENRLAGLTYLWPCLDSHAPIDLVVIMLGTNDCKPYFGLHPQNIADGAGRLVDMVQKCNFGPNDTAPKVLLISPIRITPSSFYPHLFGEKEAAKSHGFPAAYKAVAERFGCAWLDASELAQPDPADGVHLDAEGHKALAEAVAEKVKELIG